MSGDACEEDPIDCFRGGVLVVDARSQSPAAQRRGEHQERTRSDDNHIEDERALRELPDEVEQHRAENTNKRESHPRLGVGVTNTLVDKTQQLPRVLRTGVGRSRSLYTAENRSSDRKSTRLNPSHYC